MAAKQTKGRQKITMKRIENEDGRLITFSKRRSGIYKKASELVTLCGAEVGVLVFSPAGKPFSFGHPSMESISNRFLGNNLTPIDSTHPLVEAYRKLRINELNQNCNELLSRLEAEKERGNMLKQMMKGKGRRQQQQSYWWEAPVDELNFQDLHQMYAMLEDLHSNLCRKINGPSSSRNPLFACTNHQNDPAGSFPHGFDYGRRHF
ncbi:hypothetical protein P3X46_026669 [Hevea brasiliensis]|uniref:MADS-box domain-containing protein n=1 Tax=Hevea brasiliensis TaxID=3981 RepID=A0ABQ9L0U5_HEVBR|nr:hypothetical protein P3X46_026669 [Hevea brasiliensis]